GEGRLTAEVAARLPRGEILGLNASENMISLARANHPDVQFVHGDARGMGFSEEFDVVISFNALHWVRAQEEALRAIHLALKPGGLALLQMVGHGERHSLVHAFVQASRAEPWAQYFQGPEEPYLHASPEAYHALALGAGFESADVTMPIYRWDFKADRFFAHYGEVTFVEWTRHVPEARRDGFVHAALEIYRNELPPEDRNVYTIYQLKAALRKPGLGSPVRSEEGPDSEPAEGKPDRG
ncbi:MAG: class I SAM-dependent methyltransferase, partial [Armatimonadetes bacterium]|nr:class I SAM-dependent methyltransferase [Armatimonadota bacterium]